MNILQNWSDAHTAKFRKEIFTFKHTIAESGLFTDEALLALLAKHPSKGLDVCSMGENNHPDYPNKFRTGDFRASTPETLLAAAKAGRIWINVRRAMNIHPEYKALLDAMYQQLAEKTGAKSYNANGGILISSPISQTPYHFDKTETILWHVRGNKRIYIYPKTEHFIRDEDYERAVTNMLDDDLPYHESFDKSAEIYDLEPNQAITWPLNSPHRVDNSSFCVSVTTEYSTKESSFKNKGMIANATLRKRLGLNPSWRNEGRSSRYVKYCLGHIFKGTGMVVKTGGSDIVSFKLDPNVPNFIVDTPPFERNF